MSPNESIGGYRIVRLIGKGGMGEVYLAEHELLGRLAAIKVLLPQFCSDPGIVDRFFVEAKASTAIRHPGIVQIFDFGYAESGSAFIVMEFLDGEGLDARLKRVGRMEPNQAARICRQVAGALQAAHDANIVHRDLKPENIFLVRDPDIVGGERAKILDFGIAKLTSTSDVSNTKTGAVMGTPPYMAPEQCRGAELVDSRADIYAIGCVFFQMLCGRPPYVYAGIGDFFMAHMQEPIPQLETYGGPAQYNGVIAATMAKSVDQRLQSMTDLSKALEEVAPALASGAAPTPTPAPALSPSELTQGPRHTTSHAPADARIATTLSSAAGEAATEPTPSGRKKKLVMVAGLAVVAAAAASIVIALSGPSDSPKTKPAAVAASGSSRQVAAKPEAKPDAGLSTDQGCRFDNLIDLRTEVQIRGELRRVEKCRDELGSRYKRLQQTLLDRLTAAAIGVP